MSPGSRGFSGLDLCHCAASLVPGGTQNKDCSPESIKDPAEQHGAQGSFLELSSVLPALLLVFRIVVIPRLWNLNF